MEAGYRHIDTAYIYMNEAAIGEVIQEWIKKGKLKREELFITTKVSTISIIITAIPSHLFPSFVLAAFYWHSSGQSGGSNKTFTQESTSRLRGFVFNPFPGRIHW